MNKKLVALVTGCVIFFSSKGQEVNFTTGKWADVAQKAKEQNKAIFVDLYFEGCMPCKQMDLTTFKNKEVSEFINANFISYKTDVFKEEDGKQLAMRYGAGGFPTYLFLSPDGKIIDITSGYSGASNFLPFVKIIQQAIQKKNYKKYTAGLQVALPQFYQDRYLNREVKSDPKAVIAFLDAQKDVSSEVPFLVMTSFGLNDQYNNYYFEHARELADAYGRMVVRNKMIGLVRTRSKQHADKRSVADMTETLRKARPVFTDKEWDRFSKIFWEDYYKMASDYEGLAAYINSNSSYDLIDKMYLTNILVLQGKNKVAIAKGLLPLYDENSKDFDQLYIAACLHFYAGEKDATRSLLEKAQNTVIKNETEKGYLSSFISQLDNQDFKPQHLPRSKPLVME